MINRVLIIEDEQPSAARLIRLISVLKPTARILAVLESVASSISWLTENECPDVVMMDVRLADGLSFDIFDKVDIKCPIIFTTAYDEYAVRAFKYNSVDYLLKPIEEQELEQALERVTQKQPKLDARLVQSLLSQYLDKEYRSRFLIPFRDGFKTVFVRDVDYFYSEHRITRAKLLNSLEETVSQTMEELEQQLDPKLFFRANRQFIINVESIHQIHNYFNGKLKVELKRNPKVEIIVSRDKALALKNWVDS